MSKALESNFQKWELHPLVQLVHDPMGAKWVLGLWRNMGTRLDGVKSVLG